MTSLVREGENVLGARLADGWYAGFFGFDAKRAGAHYGQAPELLAQLIIGFADGTTQRVATDEHRVIEEIGPASVTAGPPGRLVVDFGQNLTGWLRVAVPGPASVRIRHAEVLAADGRLYTDNLRTARQTDEFTATAGPATFEPRFTLHGFRYAEITGTAGPSSAASSPRG